MPQLWRLYRALHGPGLDGIGGTFAAGRWHSQGERVVYFGASAAIVVLERLAHTDPDLLPSDLRLGLFEVPDGKESPTVTNLGAPPSDWIRNESWSRNIGDLWIRAKSSCLLAVPSVILPEEANYVFNPRHPVAKSLRLIRERPFSFDPRLI
ncbi:MAG: RES family NAD+ phosphorylase [Bryobacteraceae bacterium]